MLSDDIGNPEERLEIKLDSNTVTRLTELVRRQYKNYLKRQLEENVRSWQKFHHNENTSFQTLIEECTEKLEDSAIKEAILSQLYQRAMLKTITAVRLSTKKCCLVDELAQLFERSSELMKPKLTEYISTATQTESININTTQTDLSLDQRIDIFQAQLRKNDLQVDTHKTVHNDKTKGNNFEKRKQFHFNNKKERHTKRQKINLQGCTISQPLVWHSPTPPPTLPVPKENESIFDVDENDEIAQELEKLFTEQETDLDEIFGIVTNVQRNCDTNKKLSNHESQITPKLNTQSNDTAQQQPSTQSLSESAALIVSTSNNQFVPPQQKTDLRYSLWPCECFMQKKRLSTTLNRLMEEDIRWHDILKYQFSVLFGEDDDDEFAPCSPTIELNEILRSSCARRISPWVVRHLMKPLNDGLIGNRFLFKKLAKKLVNYIVYENQYPDENAIKSVIENYFCIHRAVMTADDLNYFDDINLSITNFNY